MDISFVLDRNPGPAIAQIGLSDPATARVANLDVDGRLREPPADDDQAEAGLLRGVDAVADARQDILHLPESWVSRAGVDLVAQSRDASLESRQVIAHDDEFVIGDPPAHIHQRSPRRREQKTTSPHRPEWQRRSVHDDAVT